MWRNLKWKFYTFPKAKLRMSRAGRWFFGLFRKECGASVTVRFADEDYFAFTCNQKRWHAGACSDSVPNWHIKLPHEPGKVFYAEAGRRRYNLFGRKPSLTGEI